MLSVKLIFIPYPEILLFHLNLRYLLVLLLIKHFLEFFLISASAVEAAAVKPGGDNRFFAKGTIVFINVSEMLFRKAPTTPPGYFIFYLCP